MKRYLYGRDLPHGIVSYYCTQTYVLMGFTTPTTRDDLHRRVFCYNYDDGMWAAICARALWEVHPHLHPHSTLFGILHKKLELS